MPRFAANLSMMFQEMDFLDRFEAAAAAGFEAVEFLFPYDFAAADIRERLDRFGLTQALFNMPPGDWASGERGLAILPGREAEFEKGLATALDYARILGCRRLHCMAGIRPEGTPPETLERTYRANLEKAAKAAAADGIDILLEPINTRDIPGYHLNYQRDGRAMIEAIGAANLKLQLDLYHCQIMEGDLARRIEAYLPVTGHIQIAGVPERHEPDQGEVHYPYLFDLLDRLGYEGWIGCEYRPAAATEAGLGWFEPYRRR